MSESISRAMLFTRNNIYLVLAQILTVVFNPNICQYFMFIYPEQNSWPVHLGGIFFLFACPFLFYVFYVRIVLGRRNLYVLEKKKRLFPFMANIFSILLFWVFIAVMGKIQPFWGLFSFLLFINLLCLGITLFWRVSLHMVAIAASSTLLLMFDTGSHLPVIAVSVSLIILLVGWARYYLRAHTLPQIVVGSLIGLLSPWVFNSYFTLI